MSIISYYVAVMVIDMANQKRVRTLEDLAEVCGGGKLFLLVCAFQVLFSFSMMCVTLNVWADVMSDVFQTNSISGPVSDLLTSRRGQVLLGAVIVLPLCIFKRSMISLRWTAYLTVCAVAFCLMSVVIAYFAHEEGPSLDAHTSDVITPRSNWWTVMFVVIFCFSYNQRVFAVYRCIKQRNTKRWSNAVGKASFSVCLLYLLFGVAGYLTMARKGVTMDNFNYFLDDRGENIVLYNVARVIVVSSLLLTIPVDSLIASSTWRRLYNRYLRMTNSKHHYPSDTAFSNSSKGSTRAAPPTPAAAAAEPESKGLLQDESEERMYQSEDTRGPSTGHLSVGTASISTAPEYTASAAIPIGKSNSAQDLVETLVTEQAKSMAFSPLSACSPPVTTHSHLNALMNQSAVPPAFPRTLTGSSSSTSNSDSPCAGGRASESDRASFTSTSTGMTGGASSTTGSGVAGHRMLSRDEMNAIIRANSFDSSTKAKKRTQHEEDAHDELLENGLNNSWLSNTSLSYEGGSREVRGHRSASQPHVRVQGASQFQSQLIPFVFWLLCAGTCLGVEHWMLIAATVGTLATTVLLFIFPTMFYFRMTLASDFGATPIFGRIVPNALYMGIIQALGVLLLLCDICLLMYVAVTGNYLVTSD
eukprot:gene24559-27775_t